MQSNPCVNDIPQTPCDPTLPPWLPCKSVVWAQQREESYICSCLCLRRCSTPIHLPQLQRVHCPFDRFKDKRKPGFLFEFCHQRRWRILIKWESGDLKRTLLQADLSSRQIGTFCAAALQTRFALPLTLLHSSHACHPQFCATCHLQSDFGRAHKYGAKKGVLWTSFKVSNIA